LTVACNIRYLSRAVSRHPSISAAALCTLSLFFGGCEAESRAPLDADVSDATSLDAGAFDAALRDASGRDAATRDAAQDATRADGSIPEPELRVSEEAIEQSLRCPTTFTGSYDPVLFVHGTGANADLSWDWTYVPALTSFGFDVCTIDLPSASWEDIPIASEHVVHAIRAVSARASRKVTLVGHSQGTLEIRWALRHWPSLSAHVGEIIGLGGVDAGAAQAQATCAIGFCRVSTWQMRPGSRLLAALGNEAPPGIPYSSIYSETDTTAVPPTSFVLGATNVSVQSVCAGREVSHAALVSDAVVFALVVYALEHATPPEPSAVDTAFCLRDRLEGITAGQASGEEARSTAYFLATYLGGPQPGAEPALPPYVTE
jgi:triacylglycerol lipase